MGPANVVSDVFEVKRDRGFGGIPITDNGKIGGKLLGIVTSRDIDFMTSQDELSKPLSNVMTKGNTLITGSSAITLKEANELLQQSKKGN